MTLITRYLLFALCFSLILHACTPSSPPHAFPDVFDDSLILELIAEEPDIQTPIGLAIDSEDQVYVLMSHTHMPPSSYEGPGV